MSVYRLMINKLQKKILIILLCHGFHNTKFCKLFLQPPPEMVIPHHADLAVLAAPAFKAVSAVRRDIVTCDRRQEVELARPEGSPSTTPRRDDILGTFSDKTKKARATYKEFVELGIGGEGSKESDDLPKGIRGSRDPGSLADGSSCRCSHRFLRVVSWGRCWHRRRRCRR